MIHSYMSFHIIRPCELFRTNITLVPLDSQVNRFFVNFQATISGGLVITKITTKSYSFMHRKSMFSERARIFCLIFARLTVIYFHCSLNASSVFNELWVVVGFIPANLTIREVTRIFGVNSCFMIFKILLSFEFLIARLTREACIT